MKTVLITGATSGLGLEMARLYQRQGARLVLVGRRPLAQLPDDLFTEERYCQVDLGSSEAAESIKNWLDEREIETVDVLIHNAAVGYYGTVADQPTPSIAQLLQVNVKAPIAVTHALLPRVTAVRGQLVFVSSVASVLPTAEYVTYTASKAALDGFARSLRIELGEQASVLVLHPGATHTGMHEKIGISREKLNWEKFPAAAVVAQQMVAVIERGQSGRVAIGVVNKLLRRVGLTAGAIVERLMRLAARPERHLARGNSKRPHVVITGVAEGIGKELALHFAWAGFEVTGIDVNVGGALETKRQIAQRGVEMGFVAANLAKVQDVVQAAVALADRPKIDVLIHNAGISAAGHFAQMAIAPQLKVVDVNLTAPLLLTAELLRRQQLVRGSKVVFVSSLSHFVGYPGAAVYGATKDGLSSYARGLAVALGREAQMLTVYPGPTRTEHARRYSPDNSREQTRMLPEQVAAQIFTAVQRGRRHLFPGGSSKLFAIGGYLLPSWMERGMKRLLFDKMAP